MFRQFAIARFMIGFIIFILTYMVATISYDHFFHWLTAGMFILHLYIMKEIKAGQAEELERKDREFAAHLDEVQEQLRQKEEDYRRLISVITRSEENS